MNSILRRSFAAATACLAALAAASCGPAAPHNTGVYLLLDTSGTYREELDKAKQIINYTLARLDGLDTFAVARIDTGSFSEQDIMAKLTLDDRPSTGADQTIVRTLTPRPQEAPGRTVTVTVTAQNP